MRQRYPQQRISVFDIFKIGVGPSSSHTMGPWRAAQRFCAELDASGVLHRVRRVTVTLYGSLAKTGVGHGTDLAVYLGLCGYDPVTVDPAAVRSARDTFHSHTRLQLAGCREIAFTYSEDIRFVREISLDYHPNGLSFTAELGSCAGEHRDDQDTHDTALSRTYFSIGGGFVVEEDENDRSHTTVQLPYPIDQAADILRWTRQHGPETPISEIAWANERVWDPEDTVAERLLSIYDTMRDSVHNGLRAEGVLPGGVAVRRRAARIARTLFPEPWPRDRNEFFAAVHGTLRAVYSDITDGSATVRGPVGPGQSGIAGNFGTGGARLFERILRWVSAFALAVNEENADFGRVVTAPTNGAAGVVPAVLLFYVCFLPGADDEGVVRFLLTAGEIGSIFKKGATISAAQGGCQAEIGVSSAMAAAGLTEVRGGTPEQALMAAEIAMEHHLGLTCDPVGGLVQIPCIERNTMGALKAITASDLALTGNPADARVSLDHVVETMWQTALDMNGKYKETSEAGLAAQITVNVIEC